MIAPLAGRTVLVTRPAHQAEDLVGPLAALGARTYILPAIGIAPLDDFSSLDRALTDLTEYDWLVLTSVNGVRAVSDRLTYLGLDRSALPKLAVIGPATAAAAADAFRAPDAMPAEYVSEAIAEALGEVRGQRILLARADRARRDLATILSGRGAQVDEVAAYRIVAPEAADYDLPDATPDAIALTSSAGVRGTLAACESRGKEAWMRDSALVCIGPITAATVRDLGYTPAAVAETYTMEGLVAAMTGLWASRSVAS